MKASGRSACLSKSLHSFVVTRWNSFYDTLVSFIDVYDEIRENIKPTVVILLQNLMLSTWMSSFKSKIICVYIQTIDSRIGS